MPDSNAIILGTSAENMAKLWSSAVLKVGHVNDIGFCAKMIQTNWQRYANVAKQFAPMPPWVVGCIHGLEASFNFKTHLANGDPLFDKVGGGLKTTHVPKGLGPFKNWEEGAIAAFRHMGWTPGMAWDIGNALMRLRAYNGTGYERGHGINTPYVWSMTNHYSAGKYVSDGVWSGSAVSSQVGAAATLLALQAAGVKIT